MSTMTMNNPPRLGTGQALHFGCLAILLAAAGLAWNAQGQPHPVAFWTAMAFPILHQIYVWLAWRLELQSSSVSRRAGFPAYLAAFFFLFLGRFVTLFVLGWLDAGSLQLAGLPRVLLTVLLCLPGVYTLYSVQRYFGMRRAAGADHFELRYRSMPLVKKGIFRFTSNAMYLCGFLLFWAIAIGWNSKAALTVAAFSHAYIWVHYFATEKPDMEYLYGTSEV